MLWLKSGVNDGRWYEEGNCRELFTQLIRFFPEIIEIFHETLFDFF